MPDGRSPPPPSALRSTGSRWPSRPSPSCSASTRRCTTAGSGWRSRHYDARAHLVVARRILDSLTPGWQQIGAVWLPLPHVLNMLPVQVDAWYRIRRVAPSRCPSRAWRSPHGRWRGLRVRTTGSVVGGVAGAALLMLNPNLLYLQSTPMTEPLLLATCLLAMALTADWVDARRHVRPRAAGWAIVAACMTRYEAWPICGALIALACAGAPAARRAARREPAAHRPAGDLSRDRARRCSAPTAAGRRARGSCRGVLRSRERGAGACRARLRRRCARASVGCPATHGCWPAYVASCSSSSGGRARRSRCRAAARARARGAAALPWYAFYQGHPLRIRYGLPLVAACAALTATGIGTALAPAAAFPPPRLSSCWRCCSRRRSTPCADDRRGAARRDQQGRTERRDRLPARPLGRHDRS